uniref:Uncharacterized protein n=1 Tax=Ananas comosus var. bracteatus TaxID=296719 RepID=A0A6V7PNL2_ANACO|nr:unnamed protein product [Ananas comosus var. bracteatus]
MERETNNNNNNNNNNNDDEANTLLQYCSSIALLQERFKQLQKVKEMREKSRSGGCFNILSRRDEQRQPPAVWLFHAELTRASPPGLDTSCNNKNRENTKEYGELDVDTSLHL